MEEIETKIKVPKTEEEQLKQLIEATNLTMKNSISIKSNPIKALCREGLLTYEFVMSELSKIAAKTSTLSAGKRAAIALIARVAHNQFMEAQYKAKLESVSGDNNSNQKQ